MMQHNLIVIPLIILAAVYLAGRNKPRHMLALAIIGFSVVYGPVAVGRLQVWNVFHYYLGAKYFKELGYYDIYNCALHVGKPGWVDFDNVRDLHRYSYEPIYNLPGCPLQKFTPDRLREFTHDVRWLHDQPSDKPIDKLWPAMFRDKGLNTTPYWLAFAAPLANATPVGSVGFWLLLYSDFGLIVAGLIIAGRRFGVERAALAAVFLLTWPGTYPQLMGHWFQYVWLFLVLVAVSTYQNRPALSGGALAMASWLRIFPGALFLTPLVKWRQTPKRFWEGGILASLIMLIFALPIDLFVRPGPVLLEFLRKMRQHSAYILGEPGNIGLRNLVYTVVDWNGAVANWDAFARAEMDSIPIPEWLWAAWLIPVLINAGWIVYNTAKAKRPGFSAALPSIFVLLVLSRYYYAINVVYTLEHGPRKSKPLLLISLALFVLTYFVHPLVGYLVAQVSLLLFYWRQIWALVD
jgi:hypothetical protein